MLRNHNSYGAPALNWHPNLTMTTARPPMPGLSHASPESPDSMPPTTPMPISINAPPLAQVQARIRQVVSTLTELGICALDVQPASATPELSAGLVGARV